MEGWRGGRAAGRTGGQVYGCTGVRADGRTAEGVGEGIDGRRVDGRRDWTDHLHSSPCEGKWTSRLEVPEVVAMFISKHAVPTIQGGITYEARSSRKESSINK